MIFLFFFPSRTTTSETAAIRCRNSGSQQAAFWGSRCKSPVLSWQLSWNRAKWVWTVAIADSCNGPTVDSDCGATKCGLDGWKELRLSICKEVDPWVEGLHLASSRLRSKSFEVWTCAVWPAICCTVPKLLCLSSRLRRSWRTVWVLFRENKLTRKQLHWFLLLYLMWLLL